MMWTRKSLRRRWWNSLPHRRHSQYTTPVTGRVRPHGCVITPPPGRAITIPFDDGLPRRGAWGAMSGIGGTRYASTAPRGHTRSVNPAVIAGVRSRHARSQPTCRRRSAAWGERRVGAAPIVAAAHQSHPRLHRRQGAGGLCWLLMYTVGKRTIAMTQLSYPTTRIPGNEDRDLDKMGYPSPFQVVDLRGTPRPAAMKSASRNETEDGRLQGKRAQDSRGFRRTSVLS